MIESNKKLAELYHRLQPADVDLILSSDFIGRWPIGFKWSRADHYDFTCKFVGKHEIIDIVADDKTVAVRFLRTGSIEDFRFANTMMMQFMRIVDGKISEIWELADYDLARKADTEKIA